MDRKITIALFTFIILSSVAYAASVGSASITAVAVEGLGAGNVTPISLNVTTGIGNITIKGPGSVESDTLASASDAVNYATSYLNLNRSRYNFTYTVYDSASSISGPSGGLALTLLAISALSHVTLHHNFGVTGTINGSGGVGEIGGIFEKSAAALAAGKNFMIVPSAGNGTFESLLYYITQQNLALPLVQVSNATQALPYAYGITSPKFFTFDAAQNNHALEIARSNLTCASCNVSTFANLTYGTLNFQRAQINAIRGNFSPVKQQMLSSLGDDLVIAQKGYLYTAADLAFSRYSTAFLLANSNLTQASAESVYNNVSGYCSSLNPPLMTSTNYEYVVGGELRQTWASVTLNNSKNELLNASTTDEIAQSISQIGTSYAWCLAANNMYKIASQSSSQFVNMSPAILQDISAKVNSVQNYHSLYSQSAQIDYKAKLYGAALYNAQYALTFGNFSLAQMNNSQMVVATGKNIANFSGGGIWPFEFANQAVFYLNQALLQNDSAQINSSIQTAYTISTLSGRLGDANREISGSFISYNPSNQTSPQASTQLAAIEDQINQIYVLLFAIVGLLFVILITLILLLLKKTQIQAPIAIRPRARRGRR